MIPSIFEVYNKRHLFGNLDEARFMYVTRMCGLISGGDPGYASKCVECGECLEKCPQSIEIPGLLADAAEELEDEGMEDRLVFVKKMLEAAKHR